MGTRIDRRRAGRLLGLLPAATFLATFGFFFVDKNRQARTVLDSGRGLLTVAAIVVGYVVLAIVVKRVTRWAWVPPLVLVAVIIGLAAWIVRPYYVDETADRELVSGPIAEPARPSGGRPSARQPGDRPPGAAVRPAQPVRLSRGVIEGIDHDASGNVSLIREAGGSVVVRFEDFDIEGTPDPLVYLVEGSDVEDEGGVDLGRLEGNRGDVLDYAVPGGVDPGPGWTVLVWCRAFAVPIANATQGAI